MAPRSSEDDDDFITTISDHDEDIPLEEDDFDPAPTTVRKRKRDAHNEVNGASKRSKKAKKGAEASNGAVSRHAADSEDKNAPNGAQNVQDDGAMDTDFEFETGDMEAGVVEDFDGWDMAPEASRDKKRGDRKGVDIDELVAKRRAGQKAETNGQGADEEDAEQSDNQSGVDDEVEIGHGQRLDSDEDELLAPDAFGMGAMLGDAESESEDDEKEHASMDDGETDSDDASVASPMAHPEDAESAASDDDDPEERAREQAFFAPEPTKSTSKVPHRPGSSSFQSMSLSRPILRGLAGLKFSEPTPIQAKTIPVALLGKDVVGGAVTGSGKTAAFMIPTLERLLYRPRKVPTTRVVILMPTRELAVQCYNVARKLAAHTDITFAQIVGGFSLREQETTLRKRPDVVIATPGRFIDHMRNSVAFAVDAVEILVLDEADRMLEDGFADELNEILTTIPQSRQTMLFSATMTSRVDQLIRVGLQRPVRLLVDAKSTTVDTLVQEFVRLRPGREDKRLAYLMQLVTTIYPSRCIVFFRQKKEAHRVRVVFSLCDLRAAELHGSMTQEQRIAAIEAFRAGTATHLLATDVASRGLDIRGVDAVLNYEAPQTHSIYLHRVGRTARAGRLGRSCTLAAEEDRKVVRAIVKAAKTQGARVAGRTVDAAAVDAWVAKLEALEDEVRAVLDDEQEARALASADMQLRKGENLLQHADEIAARPKRTWFASEAEKRVAKKAGRAELNGGEKGAVTVVGKKVSNKDRKRDRDHEERAEGKGMFKKAKEERGRKLGNAKARAAGGKKVGKGGGRAEGRHQMKMKAGKKGRK